MSENDDLSDLGSKDITKPQLLIQKLMNSGLRALGIKLNQFLIDPNVSKVIKNNAFRKIGLILASNGVATMLPKGKKKGGMLFKLLDKVLDGVAEGNANQLMDRLFEKVGITSAIASIGGVTTATAPTNGLTLNGMDLNALLGKKTLKTAQTQTEVASPTALIYEGGKPY